MFSSLILGVALTVAAPAPKAEAKKEPASPVGTWVGLKAVAGGMELPVPEGGIEFTLAADGTFSVREGKRESKESGTYKVDAKKDPAEIDIIPPADKKDMTMLGIYKVEGDTLTMCFARGPKGASERPKAFESPAGSEIMMMTLKRAKAETKEPKKE